MNTARVHYAARRRGGVAAGGAGAAGGADAARRRADGFRRKRQDGRPHRRVAQALQELGWIKGRNLRIECPLGRADPDRASQFAAELVTQAPDVLFATASTPPSPCCRRPARCRSWPSKSAIRSAPASSRVWLDPAAMSPVSSSSIGHDQQMAAVAQGDCASTSRARRCCGTAVRRYRATCRHPGRRRSSECG